MPEHGFDYKPPLPPADDFDLEAVIDDLMTLGAVAY